MHRFIIGFFILALSCIGMTAQAGPKEMLSTVTRVRYFPAKDAEHRGHHEFV